MKKWLRDVVLIPVMISLFFMLWGAWYTGIKLHSPLSPHWLMTVFLAPIPLWCLLLVMGITTYITCREYSHRLKLTQAIEASVDLKRSWNADARQHDERLFTKLNNILEESVLAQILDRLQTDDSYRKDQMQLFRSFRRALEQVGNSYIDICISEKLGHLKDAQDQLLNFLAENFFMYPPKQADWNSCQYCLQPGLNVDREGDGEPGAVDRYDDLGEELSALAVLVRGAFSNYRQEVKLYLYI